MIVELKIDDMTWGELRAFVQLGTYLADDDGVAFASDEDGAAQAILLEDWNPPAEVSP